MSKLEEEVDKNLSQMNINYELLDNQGKKINKIYNGLEHIEHNNSISQKILKRLNNLFYRFANPLKFKEQRITNLRDGTGDNTLNSGDNTLNTGDNTLNLEKESEDIIMDKIFLMKNIAYKMNEKIDEQNEILYETQEKMDTCNEGIKKNSKLINKLI
jgi:hypothetical protein